VVPNPDRIFTPGLYARVQLEGSADLTAILIDDKAVMTDQDRKYVYVVGPENKAVRKDVTLGDFADELRIVRSGLDANDKVIVAGLQKIFVPNTPVKPKIVAMGRCRPPRWWHRRRNREARTWISPNSSSTARFSRRLVDRHSRRRPDLNAVAAHQRIPGRGAATVVVKATYQAPIPKSSPKPCRLLWKNRSRRRGHDVMKSVAGSTARCK